MHRYLKKLSLALVLAGLVSALVASSYASAATTARQDKAHQPFLQPGWFVAPAQGVADKKIHFIVNLRTTDSYPVVADYRPNAPGIKRIRVKAVFPAGSRLGWPKPKVSLQNAWGVPTQWLKLTKADKRVVWQCGTKHCTLTWNFYHVHIRPWVALNFYVKPPAGTTGSYCVSAIATPYDAGRDSSFHRQAVPDPESACVQLN